MTRAAVTKIARATAALIGLKREVRDEEIEIDPRFAGPGAADLITVRGRRVLAESPVCLYAGSLVPTELLDACPPGARRQRAPSAPRPPLCAPALCGSRQVPTAWRPASRRWLPSQHSSYFRSEVHPIHCPWPHSPIFDLGLANFFLYAPNFFLHFLFF